MHPEKRLYPKPGQVDQIFKDGFSINWNPDDDRYYIQKGSETIASYKDWRNATARFKKILNKF